MEQHMWLPRPCPYTPPVHLCSFPCPRFPTLNSVSVALGRLYIPKKTVALLLDSVDTISLIIRNLALARRNKTKQNTIFSPEFYQLEGGKLLHATMITFIWGHVLGNLLKNGRQTKGWETWSARGVKEKCRVEGEACYGGALVFASRHPSPFPPSHSPWLLLMDPCGSGGIYSIPTFSSGSHDPSQSFHNPPPQHLTPKGVVMNLVSMSGISVVCWCETRNCCMRAAFFRKTPA